METAVPARRRAGVDPGQRSRSTLKWARWLHVYSSMVALLLVLFFGITGITLNHPNWTFGDETDTTDVTGTFPFSTTRDGAVDFLSMAEYVRSEYDVKGTVDSFSATGTEASIAFKDPGYSADLFADVSTGEFELRVEQQGFMAVMNDLHKGRDSGSAWRWVIDVSAGFLVAIAVTGLAMQLVLRKRRRSAFLVAGAGALVSLVLVVVTLM